MYDCSRLRAVVLDSLILKKISPRLSDARVDGGLPTSPITPLSLHNSLGGEVAMCGRYFATALAIMQDSVRKPPDVSCSDTV